jgi:threonine synthase
MTTVDQPNVHTVAVEGTFDDCQDLVKAMFNDASFRDRNRLSAVNSINWARVMAQTVYYVTAAETFADPVTFSVPTGNFGNVLSGWIAREMGATIADFIVSSNSNDILTRFVNDGDMSARDVTPTAAPSMDIQVSSNFERLLFDVGGRDGKALAAQMAGFEAGKAMQLTDMQREGAARLFTSARADAHQMAQAIRWAFEGSGELLDPHTAIGLHAARAAGIAPAVPVVTLATAHPAKFGTRWSGRPATVRRCPRASAICSSARSG